MQRGKKRKLHQKWANLHEEKKSTKNWRRQSWEWRGKKSLIVRGYEMWRGKRTKYSQCSQSKAGTTELRHQKASPAPPGRTHLCTSAWLTFHLSCERCSSSEHAPTVVPSSVVKASQMKFISSRRRSTALHKTHISHRRGQFVWPLTMNTAVFNLGFL